MRARGVHARTQASSARVRADANLAQIWARMSRARRVGLNASHPGFFFSAEISEISPKTGFIGDHRYFLIPNEIFRYS
jgi:hypothetical protein